MSHKDQTMKAVLLTVIQLVPPYPRMFSSQTIHDATVLKN